MANTIILFDRRNDPWKKVTVRVCWNSGGSDKVWVNESGRGNFDGSGVVSEVIAPGESIPCYQKVNGNSTIVVKSEKSH
ncbi:MAG: hypothetical protein HPY85_13140 [Anaerolineae bacterium]|nr:hypothetical protein [Anaerolineae bacterium]